ncbi:MAG: polyphosphate polymerase domain-containing protein [Armatimonadetes bacterium]|nr:polyphosphate polymerase domain-containing protein [Armatimonadota bacterium]
MQRARYEIKFIVDAAVKERILARGREVLTQDRHGRQGVYRVTSQYYDTTDLRAFWEKLDGVDPRSKFRLRFYGDEGPYFLEIKRRNNQTVSKARLDLEPEAALEMLDSSAPLEELSHRLWRAGREGDVLDELETASQRDLLLPSNVISYQREAWIGVLEERLRLTFDHLSSAQMAGGHRAALEGQGVSLLAPERIIMELKFTRSVPVWLREIVVSEGLLPTRFSKYAQGIDVLGRRSLTRPQAVANLLVPAYGNPASVQKAGGVETSSTSP